MENFNHKLKNVMIGVAATVASIASSPKEAEATINNGKPATEISKDQINEEENKESSFDGKQVSSFKEIKRILKDYKSIPGEVPMDLMEKMFEKGVSSGSKFFISTSVGKFFTAANLSNGEQLRVRNHGALLRKYTFTKELANKNVEVLVVAEYK